MTRPGFLVFSWSFLCYSIFVLLMYSSFCCIWFNFLSTNQEIVSEERLWGYLFGVEWDVKTELSRARCCLKLVLQMWSTSRRWSSTQHQWRGSRLGVRVGGYTAAAVWRWGPACTGDTAKGPQPSSPSDLDKFSLVKLFHYMSVLSVSFHTHWHSPLDLFNNTFLNRCILSYIQPTI